MNFDGIITGIFAFIITGIFHPVVVKCEYYFSQKIRLVFLFLGLLSCAASLMSQNNLLSGLFGILSFVLLWCVHEIHEQSERVRKGWFPENPNPKIF